MADQISAKAISDLDVLLNIDLEVDAALEETARVHKLDIDQLREAATRQFGDLAVYSYNLSFGKN